MNNRGAIVVTIGFRIGGCEIGLLAILVDSAIDQKKQKKRGGIRGRSPFLNRGATGTGGVPLPQPRPPHIAEREREEGGRWPAGDGHSDARVRPGHDRGPGGKHRKEQRERERERERVGSSERKGRELRPDGGWHLWNDGQASMTARLAAVGPDSGER